MLCTTVKSSTLVRNFIFSRAIAGCNGCLAKSTKDRTLSSSPINFQHQPDDTSKPQQRVSSFYDRYVFPEPPDVISEEEHHNVISKVNSIIEDPGRLFAVVTLTGKQYKVTINDIVSINGLIPAECGERIRLEKVCLVGGSEFTLVGRPVLPRNLVKIEATVLEKTPEVDIVLKRFRRRKNFERTHKFNSFQSLLRINSIDVYPELK